MTKQDAIIRVKSAFTIWEQSGNLVSYDDIHEACDMAVKALKKQIPMKPKRVNKNDIFDGNWRKICPTCGRVLMERITTNIESYPRHYNTSGFCWCGQAIDWGK